VTQFGVIPTEGHVEYHQSINQPINQPTNQPTNHQSSISRTEGTRSKKQMILLAYASCKLSSRAN
jgi:hypothetical protein